MSTPAASPIGELMTVNETADLLRRSPAALRYMIHAKTAPPSAMIGGRRMFRRDQVEAWVEAQFAKAASA